MNSNERQKDKNMNYEEQAQQNQLDKLKGKESDSVQKDGFRYDYDDSSNLN